MNPRRTFTSVRLLLPITMLVLASLACNAAASPAGAWPAGGLPDTLATEAVPVEPTGTFFLSDTSGTPAPDITEVASLPEPTEPPLPGMSRSSPYPRSQVVQAPNWDVQVLETLRGDLAWRELQTANQFNQPPWEGSEYLLVRLRVRSTFSGGQVHAISGDDFKVTGDRFLVYSSANSQAVAPEPRLEAILAAGEQAEGWVVYRIAQGEGNLILIVDEVLNFSDDRYRYIALDDGAVLQAPPELTSIRRTSQGTDRAEPASWLDTLTTENWELSVLEILTGDRAASAVAAANSYNSTAEEGMAYITARVKLRHIGQADHPVTVDRRAFKVTGSLELLYEPPYVVEPAPALRATLFPGGVAEGWLVLQAPEKETGLLLVFDPGPPADRRFISLQSP